jgi:DNA-binding CsgD family transcriptional regulator/DNA-binding transcriptional ArsR family regulator
MTGRDSEVSAVVAALSDPGIDVVLVAGPAGVGKSRLAHACADAVLDGESTRGGRATASPSLRAVPFGAVAHLLPDEAVSATTSGGGSLQMFAALRRALSTVGPERFILLIDDVQHLDEGTVGVVVQLINGGLIRVIATQRSGEPLPTGLSAILRSDRMVRVDLGSLSLTDTAELLRSALGAGVHGTALRALFERSQGNPLYLRELVNSALESGALLERDGIWVLHGEFAGSGLLLDIVNERLAGLDDTQREVAELLSLVQPVGLALIEESWGLDALAALEERGVIEVADDGNRHEVRLSHPLYAEILQREMLSVTRRRLLMRHVETVQSHGSRRRDDVVRLVLWRLEAGSTAPIDDLVLAARTAWTGKDFELTRRLGEAVLEAGGHVAVISPLGDALYELGEFERGAQLVADALDGETDEMRMVELAISLHRLRLWGLDDPDGALEALHSTANRLTSEPLCEVLQAADANVLAFSGKPAQAIDRLQGMRFLVPPISTLASVARAAALAQLGRTQEAIATSETGYREQLDTTGTSAVFHSALHLITGAFALTEAGRVEEAFEMASTAYDALVEVDIWLDQAWAAVNAARSLLVAGRPASARRWSQEALAAATRARFTTGIRISWVLYTAASGQLDDEAAARSGMAQLQRLPPDNGFVEEESAIGMAWALTAIDDRTRAISTLRDAADQARTRGLIGSESFVLHEALRLGDTTVADRLEVLASISDSPLAAARARHARAESAGDAAALAEVSLLFEEMGCDLLAAEAAMSASRRLASSGDDRGAGRQSQRVFHLVAGCEGASTPGLVAPGESASMLSLREREVALLAADGWSSKDIARRLFLSVRTVDNHLQHVYTKLGIRGRGDLSEALER